MMKVAAAFLGLSALAGCHGAYEPGIEQCESELLAKLKAPSTYKRIKASTIIVTADVIRQSNRELKKIGIEGGTDENPADYLSVSIEYDASNSYGVPLRDTQTCRYAVSNGIPDYKKRLD